MSNPGDPDYILGQYMSLDAFGGGWVPGGVNRNPMPTAAFLEYLRRGGETFIDVPIWREFAAQEGTVQWMTAVMTIAAELERLTMAGADGEVIGSYLDSLLASLEF